MAHAAGGEATAGDAPARLIIWSLAARSGSLDRGRVRGECAGSARKRLCAGAFSAAP